MRSPINDFPLELAPMELLDNLNQAIHQGGVVDDSGSSVTESITAAVIEIGGTHLFPIREGIVVLVADRAIDYRGIQSREEKA